MLVSTRVIHKAMLTSNFRQIVPEWRALYIDLDNNIAERKKKGQCGACGILQGSFDIIKNDLLTKPELANRLREYFNVPKLEIVVVRKDGKTEVKTLSQKPLN